jgi:hypothetical protein
MKFLIVFVSIPFLCPIQDTKFLSTFREPQSVVFLESERTEGTKLRCCRF